MRIRLLRFVLFGTGVSFGICIGAVFLPWSSLETVLRAFGAVDISFDPMIDYWLRMTSAAFALIGGLFVWFAIYPLRHLPAIRVSGVFLLIEGFVLLVHGLRLGLSSFPFLYDALACIGAGVAILTLTHSPISEGSPQPGATKTVEPTE